MITTPPNEHADIREAPKTPSPGVGPQPPKNNETDIDANVDPSMKPNNNTDSALLRDTNNRPPAPTVLIPDVLLSAPGVTPPLQQPETTRMTLALSPDEEPENENDGGEPTPPSQEGEPIARPDPLSPRQDINPTNTVTNKPALDIFDDLAALGCNLEEVIPSEKILTTLPIRKPRKDEWIRCHGEIHTVVNLYESSATRDIYLVLPAVLEAMETVLKHVRLRLAVSFSGETFVWPVAMPSLRKPVACHVTAACAAEAAVSHWIRIGWKTSDYEVHRRSNNRKDPSWPPEIGSASEMLRFVSKLGGFEVIDSIDHPVVRELRGQD